MITQDNLYALLPGIIDNVVAIIADQRHCSLLQATKLFYASKTYKELETVSTELWHLGPVQLYECFEEETEKTNFLR